MSKETKEQRRCWNNFKGVWIPYEIMVLYELSPTETVILALIHSYDNSTKPDGVGCYLENKDFSEFLNVALRTVNNAVDRLRELGFIEVDTNQSREPRRFLYSMMSVDPKGRKKTIPSAKIALAPDAKSALASGKKCTSPSAKNALPYIEVSTGDSTEREGAPLALPDFLNSKLKKGQIYLEAKRLYPLASPGFDRWFEDQLLCRLPKFNCGSVNPTTLKDFDLQVFKRYGEDIATAAVISLIDKKPKLAGNVPSPSELKRFAATISNEKQQRQAVKETEQLKRSDENEETPGMYDDWVRLADEDAAAFIERYNSEGFFRARVDSRPELKQALESAKNKIAKEAVA